MLFCVGIQLFECLRKKKSVHGLFSKILTIFKVSSKLHHQMSAHSNILAVVNQQDRMLAKAWNDATEKLNKLANIGVKAIVLVAL